MKPANFWDKRRISSRRCGNGCATANRSTPCAFAALEEMAPGKAEENLVEEILTEPDHDPDDLKALDEIWEEEVVTFGGNAGESACGPDRIQRQLRAHKRNPENTPTASL